MKIVCLDCPAKEFGFNIDPDLKTPIIFNPQDRPHATAPVLAVGSTDHKKTPAEVDLIPPEGKKAMPVRGIYKVNGDTLTLCMPRKDGSDRPAKFEASDDGSVMLLTLKRNKPGK